jgi:hypothetical protein
MLGEGAAQPWRCSRVFRLFQFLDQVRVRLVTQRVAPAGWHFAGVEIHVAER